MKAKIWNHSQFITETDPTELYLYFHNLLTVAGFKILGYQEHYFKPQGWTALWLLGESHFAIHTFPEENKSYIELSSCNGEKQEFFINQI